MFSEPSDTTTASPTTTTTASQTTTTTASQTSTQSGSGSETTTVSFFYFIFFSRHFNPYHAEFLKWNSPPSIFGTVYYHFKGYQNENLKLVSQQYRAWSNCTDVQAGLALYTGGKG